MFERPWVPCTVETRRVSESEGWAACKSPLWFRFRPHPRYLLHLWLPRPLESKEEGAELPLWLDWGLRRFRCHLDLTEHAGEVDREHGCCLLREEGQEPTWQAGSLTSFDQPPEGAKKGGKEGEGERQRERERERERGGGGGGGGREGERDEGRDRIGERRKKGAEWPI